MDSEKDLLRKDLKNQKTPEEIKKFVEDAELLGHEDITELGRKKLQEISEKADQVEKTSESRISQVNELGGSDEELKKRTGEVDAKIEEVKEDTQNKIKNIEDQGIENNEVSSESVLDEANKGIKSGYEMFNTLKNEGGDSVQRRIDSLSADFYTNSPIIKSLFRLEEYENILSASPEEIKDIYYKDFEGQNSVHEIGTVLSGINSASFKEGFFNALHNRPNELSDNLSLKAKIIDKILSARKNNWEK
jgi:hypothetical protein